MSFTRKRFLQSMAGGSVVLLFQGCGGGDDAPAPAADCPASSITVNHGHALTVPGADRGATSDRVYSIMGTGNHDHTVTLTPAMLATLNSGTPVTVTSSNANGHTHDVTITCA